jgi:hypothetical protein
MFDLAHVLELIVDGLDERALAHEQVIREGDEDVALVLAPLGDKPQTLVKRSTRKRMLITPPQ